MESIDFYSSVISVGFKRYPIFLLVETCPFILAVGWRVVSPIYRELHPAQKEFLLHFVIKTCYMLLFLRCLTLWKWFTACFLLLILTKQYSAAEEERRLENILIEKQRKLKKFQQEVRGRVKALERLKELQQLDKSYEAVSGMTNYHVHIIFTFNSRADN